MISMKPGIRNCLATLGAGSQIAVFLLCSNITILSLRAQSADSSVSPHVAQSTTETNGATSANYKLSPGDLFDFRVYQEEDLASVFRIAGDGTAIFPLIGSARLGGLTIDEATKLLATRYKQGYLVNPQVSITVRMFAKKFYTFLGQVGHPGAYDLQGEEEVPLLQAIGLAGGYTRLANPSNITIKRSEDGKDHIYRIDAKKMAKSADNSSVTVRAGDVITVGEALF